MCHVFWCCRKDIINYITNSHETDIHWKKSLWKPVWPPPPILLLVHVLFKLSLTSPDKCARASSYCILNFVDHHMKVKNRWTNNNQLIQSIIMNKIVCNQHIIKKNFRDFYLVINKNTYCYKI